MKYKKIFFGLISLVFVFCLTMISTAKLYPLEKIDVNCEEILLQDYEDYYGYSLPKNSKTLDVFKEPNNYLIVDYEVHIKNNTSKTLFVENYTIDIPKYNIIYFKNDVDFYSYYEYKPNEKSKCFGHAIIYIGDNDKQRVLNEVNNSMSLKMWYWVYYNNLISLLTFLKV